MNLSVEDIIMTMSLYLKLIGKSGAARDEIYVLPEGKLVWINTSTAHKHDYRSNISRGEDPPKAEVEADDGEVFMVTNKKR